MKKSLIAAAVAAAIAVPSANAGVTIYGKINSEILHESKEWANRGRASSHDDYVSDDRWRVTTRSSRLGFKGTEDLGNGLKAIWKMEGSFDVVGDDDNEFTASRNAYIGLSGDWGTFFYGRHDTPYKTAYYSTGADIMDGTVGDMNDLADIHEVRAKGAIAYISPNMSGFTVAAAIVPGANEFMSGDSIADGWSVAAMYKGNGFKAALAYEDLTGDDTHDHEKFLVGVGWSMAGFKLGAIYQDWDAEGHPKGDRDQQSLAVSAAYSFGNTSLELVLSTIDRESDDDRDGFAIGVDHKLSKRTSVHAVYATMDDDTWCTCTNDGEGDAFSMGIVHLF